MSTPAFSRSTFPAGGWQFYQPQTQWRAPNPISNTFDQQVTNIIKHRLANTAIRIKYKLSTDPDEVANELEAFTRARLGLPQTAATSTAPKTLPRRDYAAPAAGAVAAIKKVAAGGALLLEWEVSGQPPVAPELAAKRAFVCAKGNAGQRCPKNSQGDFTSWFTKPISEILRQKMARVNSMNLTTPHDAELGVCSACECPLRLKVQTPLDLILKHLKPEARADLWPGCWILAGT